MDTKDKDQAKKFANLLIDDIGGTAKTAALCKTSESAVSQWRDNGIPEPRQQVIQLLRPDSYARCAKQVPPAPPP